MKVVIVGGGVSGLTAAIYAKKNGNDVTVLERNSDVLKKVLLTGNGKCNYYNENQKKEFYHSENNELIEKIINKENLKKINNYFDKLGIVPFIKDGYYYPYSNQAISIKEVIKNKAIEMNVNIINDYYVENIREKDGKFLVNEDIFCDVLIISTGSKAYPKTGSDGIGYKIARKFGHKINEIVPALVKLKTDEKYLKELKGVRTKCNASIYIDDEYINSIEGELQLNEEYISGICIFNLSFLANKALIQNKKVEIKINYLPFLKTKEDVNKFFESRRNIIGNKEINKFFDGLLNYKIVNVILKKCNIDQKKMYDELLSNEKNLLIKNIFSYSYNIIGSASFDNSQICAGGVSLNEVNLDTMESKIKKNLYVTGELLDVNGDCGGYNLTFAFITGLRAGENIK